MILKIYGLSMRLMTKKRFHYCLFFSLIRTLDRYPGVIFIWRNPRLNPFIFVVKAHPFTTEKSKYNSILPMIIFCSSCSFFVFFNLLFGWKFQRKISRNKRNTSLYEWSNWGILAGYKSDGIHAKIINSALK